MIDQREPTLDELLNEPIIQQVMKSDGVRPDDIRRLMETVQRSLPAAGDGFMHHAAFPQHIAAYHICAAL